MVSSRPKANPDMRVTSLAAAVKNGLRVFERGEHLLQNSILHFAFAFKSIFRNRVSKLGFKQTKNGLF